MRRRPSRHAGRRSCCWVLRAVAGADRAPTERRVVLGLDARVDFGSLRRSSATKSGRPNQAAWCSSVPRGPPPQLALKFAPAAATTRARPSTSRIASSIRTSRASASSVDRRARLSPRNGASARPRPRARSATRARAAHPRDRRARGARHAGTPCARAVARPGSAPCSTSRWMNAGARPRVHRVMERRPVRRLVRVAAMLEEQAHPLDAVVVERMPERVRPRHRRAALEQQPGAGIVSGLDGVVERVVVVGLRARIQQQRASAASPREQAIERLVHSSPPGPFGSAPRSIRLRAATSASRAIRLRAT